MTLRRAILSPAALCLLLGAGLAQAQAERRLLLDGELQARSIRLISLTSDTIVYEDDKGRRRQATVGGFVGLLPATPPYGGEVFEDDYSPPAPPEEGYEPDEARASERRQARSRPGTLELVDGQRFPGERIASGGDAESISWSHPAFGRISVPLDRVAEVVLDAGVRSRLAEQGRLGAFALDVARSDVARSKDELLLSNGDALSGFIESVGDPVRIEVEGQAVDVGAQRVAVARFASRPEPLAGMVVWLADGSVAVVASIGDPDGGAGSGQRIRVELPGGQAANFSLDALRAVAFDAGKLRALASIRPQSQRAVGRRVLLEEMRVLNSGGRRDASAGQLSAPDVEFPGPMQAVWRLPAGARRFAGVAELPPDALPWGDCELVIALDGVEAWRTRLSIEQPRAEFSVALVSQSSGGGAGGARDLTITIEPGQRGPVNDRVVLRRPLLLVEPR